MADLLTLIETLTPEKRRVLAARLRERGRDYNAFPLSFAQQRMWLLDQLTPGSPAYNILGAVRITGPMHRAELLRSLETLVQRHEALRTCFIGLEGEPFQVILPEVPSSLPLLDLTGLPVEHREAEMLRLAQEDARQPFDLLRGPLLRTTLLRLAPEDHVLLLSMHHSISDGWSIGVLVQELTELWRAYCTGQEPRLPALTLQYADFALWQRAPEQEREMERQLHYWQERLAGAPPLLPLPTDHPRLVTPTFRGGEQVTLLPPTHVAALRNVCRETDTTPFMALLAAFAALLQRITGESDVIIGSPIANRQRAELEALVGFFVNTLALRVDMSEAHSFRALLAHVREITLAAYEHQDLPFERLVEALHPERSLNYAPLFQVMFVHQEGRVNFDVPGIAIRPFSLPSALTKFDLTLVTVDRDADIEVTLEYNTDLFDAETAARLLAYFKTLLMAALAAPDHAIADLPLLSAEEQAQLLAWAVAPESYPQMDTIPALFADTVAVYATVPALVWENGQFTYADLDARANRLAHRLREAGLRRGGMVGLYADRTPVLIVGMLGILKAGGAYLPLDPDYPAARLAYMLTDSGVQLVVGQRDLDAARIAGPDVLWLAADTNDLAGLDTAPPLDLTPDDLAYIIYTSGSTGQPKGVLVPHRGVINFCRVRHAPYPIISGDHVLQFASPSFDAAVAEIFPALLNGATLYLPPAAGLRPGPEFIDYLSRYRITHVTLPPSALAVLPDAALPALRTIISAGEACPAEIVDRWAPGRHFYNAYGPTEVTVCATYAEVSPGSGPPPIGGPLANQRVYVLDARGQLAPVGVFGELYVGGVGVTWGYLGRAALTAERFVPDAFSTEPGARLYRTGDVVRWRADGQLEFLGRSDHQVKVRGFRVELGEVEAALRAQPGVQDAVVIARQGQLIGYVTPEPGMALEGAVLRTALEQRLPAHMLPAIIMPLAALPLTPNGKVDRAGLPAPVWADATQYAPPETPEEALVAGIWQEVLGLERVGRDADFFALGGHSLLATQAISRVNAALSLNLPLRMLFESPTVAGFAQRVIEARRTTQQVALPPLYPLARTEALPLSFAQQRLWYLDQLLPGTALYNLPAAVRFQGDFDPVLLERSLNTVIARHEALRTTFRTVNGHPMQLVAPTLHITLPVVDVRDLPRTEHAAVIRARFGAEAARSFDLEYGPLIRGVLLHLATEEYILLLTMHHSISDGWSMGVLVRELAAGYAAFAAGALPMLPPLPIQYADFAAWQRAWLQGETLDRYIAYWKEQLAGAPEYLDLPTDRPRPSQQSFRGAALSFALAEPLTADLKALSRREGATLFMTLLAAFAALLARYAHQDELLIGTPIANRNRTEIEDLIGFFVNTLVLRIDLSDAPTFRTLLARVRETALEAYAYQDLPFEALVDALHVERTLDRNPLFQVMFSVQNTARPVVAGPLTVEPLEFPVETSKFDLSFTVVEEAVGMSGTLVYNTDLFMEETVARLLVHYETFLAAALAEPDRPVTALSLLTANERAALLHREAAPSLAPVPSVPLAFATQAAHTPDAPAIIWGDTTLTYAELAQRAAQLAQHLRGLGIDPEATVGVCLESTPELLVGLLGVLMAGGVYVPLASTDPPARQAYILEDARIAALVTTTALAARLPEGLPNVVRLDADVKRIAACPITPPALSLHPDNAAYVIYTSGSTGQPKGVVVSHRSLSTYLDWINRVLLSPPVRLPALTTPAFDASLKQLCAPLLRGDVVWLPERDVSPEHLLQMLAAYPETAINCVPALWQALLDALERGAASPGARLKKVLLGGEALPFALVARTRRHFPAAEIWNVYGPTETTANATVDCVVDDVITIGQPLDYARIYVVDGKLQLVPAGLPGELLIGGIGIARGYLNRPVLTAERFIPNPFSGEPGARLYRTGDRVKLLADGRLVFLGRTDAQVKFHGYRIELGEIEAALTTHPAVIEAVVMLRDATGGEPQLVAYIVPDFSLSPDVVQLRQYLRGRLPDYMIPAAFVLLPHWPLTAAGKVDRRALPVPEVSRIQEDYVAPRTSVEELLAEVWAALLGVEQVGIHDNFFALGGDSLLSLQVIAQAGNLGIHLTPRQFLEYQTVAELAAVCSDGVLIQADQDAVVGPVPLTPIQRRFLAQLPPHPAHWNQALYLELRCALSPQQLRQAVKALWRHHDALRLHYIRTEAEGWQQVAWSPEVEPAFTVHDLSAEPATTLARALESACDAAHASLDLSAGPLLRVVYFDLGVDRPVRLLIVAHHLLVDAFSWRVLLEDLETACRQLSAGRVIRLPRKTTAFKAWAERLVDLAHAPELRTESDYWRKAVRKPVAELPVDRPEGVSHNTVAAARTLEVALTPEETAMLLHDLPVAYPEARIEDALLAALGQTFTAWTGQTQTWVELESHGREARFDDINLTRTVGWFTALYPFCIEMRRDSRPDAALKAVLAARREVPGDGLSYGLLRYLGDARVSQALSAGAAPPIRFNYLGQTHQGVTGLTCFAPVDEPSGAPQALDAPRSVLFEITAAVVTGCLRISWRYPAPAYTEETVAFLARRHTRVLGQIAAESQTRAAEEHTRTKPLAWLQQQARGMALLPAQLRVWVRGARGTERHLVALQRSGTHPPLFLMHPAGGEVLCYMALTRYLGREQPVYGLEAVGLRGERPHLTKIEGMAAEHIAAVRSAQPEGPYYLSGWSFGGLLAFEMARQLQSAGQPVAFLGLIDTGTPGYLPPDFNIVLIEAVIAWLEGNHRRKLGIATADLRRFAPQEQLDYVLTRARATGVWLPEREVEAIRRQVTIHQANMEAQRGYAPGVYPGELTFFRAAEIGPRRMEVEHPDFVDPDWGWGRYTSTPVKRHTIPGHHETVIEAPHVQVLAQALHAALERGRATSPPAEAAVNQSRQSFNPLNFISKKKQP